MGSVLGLGLTREEYEAVIGEHNDRDWETLAIST